MPCPPEELWLRLVEETLDLDRTVELRGHLEECDDCQARLDRLTEPASLSEYSDLGEFDTAEWPASLETRLRLIANVAAAGVGGAATLAALGAPARGRETGETIAQFRIDGLLGRGGIGIVYRGWDTRLERAVALKFLRDAPIGEGARDALVREARAASALQHDHLVPVHGIEMLEAGELVLVMPLIEGESVRQKLDRDGAFTPRAAAEVARQIADALAALHAAGMVHRDVKPGNILLDRVDGRAKLSDFGLARLVPEGSLTTGDGSRLIGTPEYLCPDGIRDANALANPSSDVYALGVTLYEMLTGAVPFHGQPHRVLHQILTQDPPAPRQLNDLIPRDLETICLKAMSGDRAARYPNAAALREDLTKWLDGRPIEARPASPLERGLKWAKRRPWQAATLGIGGLLLVASTSASLLLHHAYSETTDANRRLTEARALSDESFRLSQGALHQIVDRVTEQLFSVPNTTPLLMDTYDRSVNLHAELVRLRPEDRESILGYGNALSKLCGIQMLHASIPEAERTYQRYLAFAEQENQRFPDDPKIGLMLVDALRCRETLSNKQGQADEARAATARCREILERLEQRHADVPEVLQARVVDLMSLITDQRRARDYEAAIETGKRAVAALERWRDLVPEAPDPWQTLDFLWILQARSLEALGRLDEATEAARQAEIAQQARQLKSVPQRDRDWSLVQLRKIQAKLALARRDGSESVTLSALETLLRGQIALYPEEDGLREDLVLALRDRAKLAFDQKDSTAGAILNEAKTLAERLASDVPQVARYRELAASLEALMPESAHGAAPKP